jgi:hypothetical protein
LLSLKNEQGTFEMEEIMSSELHHSELGMSEPEAEEQTVKPVRHTKTAEQKLADLQQQLVRVQAEVRKIDTRRKVVLGGACLAIMKEGPSDVSRFRALLWQALSEKDRALVHDLFWQATQ